MPFIESSSNTSQIPVIFHVPYTPHQTRLLQACYHGEIHELRLSIHYKNTSLAELLASIILNITSSVGHVTSLVKFYVAYCNIKMI